MVGAAGVAGAGGVIQVMNMGQAFSVAVLAAVISMSIPVRLVAQGRGGMPAHAGASMASAPHSAAMSGGMAGARVGAGSLGHVMISRSASGQVMLRRGVAASRVRNNCLRMWRAKLAIYVPSWSAAKPYVSGACDVQCKTV